MTDERTSLHDDQIESFTSELHSIFQRDAPRPEVKIPLYHYTDAAGLSAIFRTQRLWFTSALHMNDPSELRHGLARIGLMFRKHAKEGTTPNEKVIAETCRLFENMLAGSGPLHFWLACLSKNGDDLGQWRGYGDDGRGFAIGLTPEFFNNEQGLLARDGSLSILDVEYDALTFEQVFSPLIDQALGALINAIQRIGKAEAKNPAFDMAAARAAADKIQKAFSIPLLVEIMFRAISLKHDAYKNEAEMRLMMFSEHHPSKANVLMRNRGSVLVPYIEKDIPIRRPGCVFEIVVGPSAITTAEEAVRSMLGSYGLLPKVNVRRSGIPYRSPR